MYNSRTMRRSKFRRKARIEHYDKLFENCFWDACQFDKKAE